MINKHKAKYGDKYYIEHKEEQQKRMAKYYLELHIAELITDDEYAELARDHASVAKLEAWDAKQR